LGALNKRKAGVFSFSPGRMIISEKGALPVITGAFQAELGLFFRTDFR
jgi:hypothetical protein